MCNISGVIFGTSNLSREEVEGKRVLEVGSMDMNGSLRLFVESLAPSEYIGVDLQAGKGVDEICNAEQLDTRFEKNSFDLVVATELLEHVQDWRKAISNIKAVCKPGGIILVTTRSKGFRYHPRPGDFWRYEVDDMKKVFSDFEIITVRKDEKEPGVFLKARKPQDFKEVKLDDLDLFCIVTGKKQKKVDQTDQKGPRFFFVSAKSKLTEGLIKFGKWLIKTQ